MENSRIWVFSTCLAAERTEIHWWWSAWACLRLTREDQNSYLTQSSREICRRKVENRDKSRDCSKKAPIERLHMIMKLENSYESQETKNRMRNKIYSPSRCLQRQLKAQPNDGQEMNFSRCESLRTKAKDVRWHFDASRQIISIIF